MRRSRRSAALSHVSVAVFAVSSEQPISVIATTSTLRVASIYLQLGQHDQALSILEGQSDDGFLGLIYNLMGDIYLDLGNRAEAQKFYGLAIDNVSENSNLSQLIQIKLDDLN